ncbi:MAG: PAS domain-containing protein [Verrucomicrobiota bacterium]
MKPDQLQIQEVLEGVSDSILSMDSDLRYIYVNEPATKVLGLSRDEMLGRRIDEVFPEITESKFYGVVKSVREDGKVRELEEYYAPLESWYNCRFHRSPNGGVTVFFTDSTNQRRTNHRLRLALAGGKMGAWEHDYASGFCTFDERLGELFGFPPSQWRATGDEFTKAIHPDDRDSVAEAAALALNEKSDFDHEFRVLLEDGTIRWIEGKAALTFDSEGEAISMVGVSFDITDRKRQENELRDLAEDLQHRVEERTQNINMIAENVPGFFSVVDQNLEYAFVNRKYEEAFGLPIEQVRGMPVRELLGDGAWKRVEPKLRAALNGVEQIFETETSTPNSGELTLRVCYIPQRNAEKEVTGVYVLGIDITNETRLQQEVLDATEREKMRIGIELHDDLCQRLSGMGFRAKVLAKKLAQVGQDELSAEAEENVRQLNESTKFTRDLARGMAPIAVEGQTLQQAWRTHLEELQQQHPGLELHLDVALRTRELSNTMANQLWLISREAVRNALHHGNASRVDVRFWAAGMNVFLAILDNGEGDPVALQELVNRENERGLGLRSMAHRARLLGGSFRIESGIGRPGVQVICRLPLEQLEIPST